MARHKTLLTHAARRERRERILAEIVAGKGIAYLCKKYGLSAASIKNIASANGHYFKYSFPKATATLPVLKRMLDGESQTVIARDLGVSRQRVFQIKQEAVEAGFKIGKKTR
jgi:hypothetical protein